MENKNLEKDKIAFKDFKGSVTKSEFETVLVITREEYYKCKRLADLKEKFDRESAKAITDIEKQSADMPPGLKEKLIKGFQRAASRETMEVMEKEISRSNSLVDFLNRFQETSEMLPYLEFNITKTKK
jgi:hypothetical protein